MASDAAALALDLPQLGLLPPLTSSAADEEVAEQPSSAWSSSFHARSSSNSTTPRSKQSSSRGSPPPPSSFSTSFRSSSSRFSPFSSRPDNSGWRGSLASALRRGRSAGREQGQWPRRKKGGGWSGWWPRRSSRSITAWIGVVAFFFLMNWWMFSRLQEPSDGREQARFLNGTSLSSSILSGYEKNKRHQTIMLTRLLALAAHALAEAENKPEPPDLWQEPFDPASSWIPCAHQRTWEPSAGNNGYILVSANGGISQQRVAICNAVAVARLLNSTLIIPRFLYSSVWKDKSDIYQEEHFINYLKDDIRILRELPLELQSLDLEAIGSLVTDLDVMKEAKPSFYVKKVLPILLKNGVVHFVGFGNRLAFDPIPFELQRLRCRCNFHALRFVDKIQKTGALLVQRMRGHVRQLGPLERNLLGPFAVKSKMITDRDLPLEPRYLSVHLRFEIDMAAYSMCYFGGGKDEEHELEAYRAVHFPALTLLRKTSKLPSAAFLRSEGKCPLTPEEAVLMLAALGFKRRTSIYIAGAHIYGGKARMAALTNLYPKLATKESLLSSSEIKPFLNFSSQLAALDFIVSAAADAFAMTDSGSQLSSLVSGYRMYYGGGKLPTIRPNKRRLASIFSKNSTIEWKELEERVRKAAKESKKVQERPVARSIYRHPRSPECMCKID